MNLNVGFVSEGSHCIPSIPDIMADCSDHCIRCGVPVRARQEGLQCDGCGRWQHRKCDSGISRVDYWTALKSGITIDWSCDLCKDEQATPQVELESSVEDPPSQDFESEEQVNNISMELEASLGDVPLQDTRNEEHATCPMELETSLEDPPLMQDFDSEAQATPPVLVSFQLFEEGTKRGRSKLIDSLGYTYNIKLRRPNVTYWQCTVRPKVNPCKATVTQKIETFVKTDTSHNHPPSTGSASTTKITSQVKKMAVQDLFKSASVIVDEVSLLKIIAYI